MHTKFESKSNRVKGLSFHPTRPWILSSLHNGAIQLWDYRNRSILDSFEEHDGPVRGIDFHHSQPLFVSGGDDYKIKVWNYKLRRCLFTLLGHLDYVRTVKFHHIQPWLLSASDDQTIRIWNWQSRALLSTITGHNHYVMSAMFHPKDDLVVSASLDNTVRVWDISALRKKGSKSGGIGGGSGGMSDVGGMGRDDDGGGRESGAISGAASGLKSLEGGLKSVNVELFGGGDVSVKYLLEGHERGVNWASFHPTLPLIVSAADDRQVKLWRMNETKAWEVDTLRGHTNNVSCVVFHSGGEYIVSNAEDRSIKVWDISRRVCLQTFRRDHDRFWILAVHPTKSLLAAGHDSGMLVFNLERERPAYDITHPSKDALYYVDKRDNRYIKRLNYKTGEESVEATLQRMNSMGNSNTSAFGNAPKLLSKNVFNTAEVNLLITSTADGGSYELINVKGKSSNDYEDGFKGHAIAACFVARNRFAVLEQNKHLVIKNMRNEMTKRVVLPFPSLDNIYSAGIAGKVLVKNEDKISLFELQSRRVINELVVPQLKFVVWDASNDYCAFLCKHAVIICDKNLEQKCSISETIRVKSGAWIESTNHIFVYSTLNHVKYIITNGDYGILQTLEQPIYVTKVDPNIGYKANLVHSCSLYALDRDCKLIKYEVDTTECDFKVSLMKQQFGQVMKIIKNSKLTGKAIIGYLQTKGFPEVALHFVEDKHVRFKLALTCGNLDVAMQCCLEIDDNSCWTKLAKEALRQGNYNVVEMCFQKTRNFDKLSFLYLISGSKDKLNKMLKIAENRKDVMSRFQNALFLGNVAERVKVLESVGQLILAYSTAKMHNLTEDIERLTKKLAENELPLPKLGVFETESEPLTPPEIISEQEGSSSTNWPLLEVKRGVVHEALLKGVDLMAEEELIDSPQRNGEEYKFDDENNMLEEDEFAVFEEKAKGKPDGLLEVREEKKLEVRENKVEAADDENAGWGLGEDEEDLDFGHDASLEEISKPRPKSKKLDEFEQLEKLEQNGEHGFMMPRVGADISSLYSKTSNLAIDHCAAGEFDSAKNLLNRQIGVTNFEPLMQHMFDIFIAAKVYLPTSGGASAANALSLEVLRNDKDLPLDIEENKEKCLPASPFTLEILSEKLEAGFQLFQGGQFSEAISQFREILYMIPFIVTKRVHENELKEMVSMCKEYILGLLIEFKRKEINALNKDDNSELKIRALELAVYFGSCKLQAKHLVLVLNVAMKAAYKMNNFITAAGLAQRLLSMSDINLESNKEKKSVALKVLKKSQQSGRNEYQIEFKKDEQFDICASSLKPIYVGEKKVKCPFCNAFVKEEVYAASQELNCQVCEIATVGVETLGLICSNTDRV